MRVVKLLDYASSSSYNPMHVEGPHNEKFKNLGWMS